MSTQTIALAGQPNGGKSTVFNALTGARQFVANYPGVTVDKMMGWCHRRKKTFEVVDLPGTYSLTSYSPEERVSRNFLINDRPSAVINVLDASNLRRGLYLTFQLLEMKVPLLVDLNMMDVAEREGMRIDAEGLSLALGVPVITTSMRTKQGRESLWEAVDGIDALPIPEKVPMLDYAKIEKDLNELEALLTRSGKSEKEYPVSWLAVKLMEGDADAHRIVRETYGDADSIIQTADAFRKSFKETHGSTADSYISAQRYRAATETAARYVTGPKVKTETLSDRVDKIVCGKFLGPIILLGIIYVLYRLSIVEGYRLTNYTWPILAWFRATVESVLPTPEFIHLPIFREFVLWCLDSVNALLNYIPIFFILFGLIAILEDSGYMPRMAFIMDRILRRFGLHGQSTLSMVLGGVVVGGCIVPGVMSTKGIPDERSRLATILTLPMLNCLAKVPLYILLINIYFAESKSLVMFFISTISILFVLPVAKILSMTVLRNKPTAPFIMEMPPYHIPTIRGILGRAVERVWLYIRKITTVVAAVAVVLFVLLQFPGLDADSMAEFKSRKDESVAAFFKATESNPVAADLKNEDDILALILYQEEYRAARRDAGGGEKLEMMNRRFEQRNQNFFKILTDKKDKDAASAEKALRGVINVRRTILMQMRQKRIENSLLGRAGKSLEPVSGWAGFNWRVNIAILSSLAAKESTVATLGSLYQESSGESDASLETRMASQETGFSALHAVALMLFMVLCPPCFPTAIAIRVQTGSALWMLFSFFYPLALGLAAASLAFSGGSALGLTGMQTMWAFYLIPLSLTLILGLFGDRKRVSIGDTGSSKI